MDGLDMMISDHDKILKMVDMLESSCLQILNGTEINIEDFHDMIFFLNQYVLKHHTKEENLLFTEIGQDLGITPDEVMRDHDRGRYHIKELESALKRYFIAPTTKELLTIITHAGGEALLLRNHIHQENKFLYDFIKKNLKAETLEKINERVSAYRNQNETQKSLDYCSEVFNRLSKKYLLC